MTENDKNNDLKVPRFDSFNKTLSRDTRIKAWTRVPGRQWKGRGVDGRISPRTGASRRKPWPIARARDRMRGAVVVPCAVARGLEMRALDGVSAQSLAGFGCESFA